MKLDKKIIITGGGSGGHVSAALAFIDGLRERYDNTKQRILYIGGTLPMEGEKNTPSHESKRIKDKDIPFTTIRAGKLQRSFSTNSIPLILGVLGGIIDANRELSQFKPDIIFSTGGFVSLPVVIAAYIKRIPIYIHEQTAAIGLTNKIASRLSKRIYVSFKDSIWHFNPRKTLHTGNLVRKSLFQKRYIGETVRVIESMKKIDPKLPIIYISGGGQGSHTINTVIKQGLKYYLQNYQIILQTGDNTVNNDYVILSTERLKLEKKLQSRLHITKFIPDNEIGYVFQSVNLFVGRSGANTVYELGIFKLPSVLIPVPWVTQNEQYKNAAILEKLGLSKILPEGELSSEKLNQLVLKELQNRKESSLSRGKSYELSAIFPVDGIQKVLNDMGL